MNDYPFETEAEADAFLLALRTYYHPAISKMTKLKQEKWIVRVELHEGYDPEPMC